MRSPRTLWFRFSAVPPDADRGLSNGRVPIGKEYAARDTWFATLLSLALLIALARFYTYTEPLEMDAAKHAAVANELHAGSALYADVWDHEPPAIHATYFIAQGLFGYGMLHVYVLGLFAAVGTMLGVFVASSCTGAGALAGVWGAAFWALLCSDLYLQANQPNAEAFVNLCLVWAFALLLRLSGDRVELGRTVLIGGFLVLATLYKQVALVAVTLLLAAHVWSPRGGSAGRRRALGQVAVIGGVGIMTWLGVFLHFAQTARLDDFWNAVFVFNGHYGGNPITNLFVGFSPTHLFPPQMYPTLPLVVVGLLGAVRSASPTSRRALLLAAYAAGSFVAVDLPGGFFGRYYQLWLPVVVIAGAWGLSALRPRTEPANSRWLSMTGPIVALLLLLTQLPYYSYPPEEWSVRKFGRRLVYDAEVARRVDDLLLADETFYVWGHEAELYYYSGRRPPTPEFRSADLLAGPLEDRRVNRVLASLAHEHPELVLVSRMDAFPVEHRLPHWLLEHYVEIPDGLGEDLQPARFRVFYLRGGRLETERPS